MLGERQSWRTVSYIFSDVFDLTFNVVGTTPAADERIVRGSGRRTARFPFSILPTTACGEPFCWSSRWWKPRPPGRSSSTVAILRRPRRNWRTAAVRSIWTAVQTVLILQGGGALGAFECGVVKALEEQKIHPDLVAGVSIGAFNAAIIAANPRNATAALEAFWRELSMKTLDAPNEELRRTISSLQSLVFGAPNFFRPRWFEPVLLRLSFRPIGRASVTPPRSRLP